MPTIQIEVRAIKLTKDLLGERGSILLVFPDDRLELVSAETAAALGMRGGTNAARASAPHQVRGRSARNPRTPPVVPARSYKIEVEGKTVKVTGQGARILAALGAAVGANNHAVPARRVGDFTSQAADGKQATVRLGDLTTVGLVNTIETPGKARTFSLTNNGLYVLKHGLLPASSGKGAAE
jgi:hypothetical protein